MRITKSEEYGLRLALRLAATGGQLTIRELAEREAIPETTVAKVIARLRAAGLVRAVRGRNGGYALAAPASSISVARIVDAFDERLYDSGFCDRMAPGEAACSRARSCGLRPVWRGLAVVVGDFLAGITVADVLAGGATGGRGSLPLAAGRRT
ncbi:MAG TPA: Rrf2 family transcriptional regulator [Thermoanaerobaculales bacterium]|nr:Rrf2 family transcriptional regulator [Thermoanaerobaculales bacterium]HPA82323.1 Rrf2 family transcriptional regulator [Thermoanaerobaculales bacterium]HQL30966.1 Rrf2 family transcriptional regulator [Thermoanaerobaculales bacterium]HQN95714.1 Rrf2 family transcriptional regulator [Thermoanaerobaculales bacterium]HQP42126.1 Rrf2 family transcriptional regulator [Thermoanaerobaculales bacterium]